MMKKLIIAASFMLAVSGFAAAQPSDSFFSDNPFSDGFWDDEEESSDSFEDDLFGDDWFDEPSFDDGEDENSNDSEGCEEDEYHIPEDQNCDGEIDDEFQGDSPENDTGEDPEDGNDTRVEERHVTPAPEPDYVGEDYLSYPNPRDHYKHDQDIHREGSAKVCHIMLNQRGEVVTGETVDDVQLSVDTDIPYEDARPVTFDTPVNQVADLVGTSEDLREGDGYLDAECAEFHDLRLNETYHYSQANISGEDAENVEVVGHQEFWNNQYDPLEDVEEYGNSSNSDGEITLSPGYNTRHAEVVVVSQITG